MLTGWMKKRSNHNYSFRGTSWEEIRSEQILMIQAQDLNECYTGGEQNKRFHNFAQLARHFTNIKVAYILFV